MKKLLLCVVALLASVAAFGQRGTVNYTASSARSIEPAQAVMITPMVADMEVISDRISYTESEAFADYPINADLILQVPTLEKIALSRAAKAYGADAIVAATVDVATNSQGRLEITISGYPVKYVNFRNATVQDAQLQSIAQAYAHEEDYFAGEEEDQKERKQPAVVVK